MPLCRKMSLLNSQGFEFLYMGHGPRFARIGMIDLWANLSHRNIVILEESADGPTDAKLFKPPKMSAGTNNLQDTKNISITCTVLLTPGPSSTSGVQGVRKACHARLCGK